MMLQSNMIQMGNMIMNNMATYLKNILKLFKIISDKIIL
jgi:hypothetical protein